MKAAAVLALAGAVVAFPALEKRQTIDPLSASLAVFNALPTSLQQVAITNPAAVASAISSEFLTGTPAWFGSLPSDVQSYFISVGGAGTAVPTDTALTSAVSGDVSVTATSTETVTSASATATELTDLTTTTGDSSTSATSTETLTTTESSAASESASAAASSSPSADLAALPTQVVAGGLAGVVGLMAVLAL